MTLKLLPAVIAATVLLIPGPAPAIEFNPLSAIKSAAEAFVDDTVIEGKINALLLDATGVNVTNFCWRSVQGNVFLFGRALSKPELDKAIVWSGASRT